MLILFCLILVPSIIQFHPHKKLQELFNVINKRFENFQ